MSVDNIIETVLWQGKILVKNVEKVENNNVAHAGNHELKNIIVMIKILIEY